MSEELKFRTVHRCPFCASASGAMVSNEWFDAFETGEKVSGLFAHPPYRIVKCTNCDLHYKSAVPLESTFVNYYNNLDTAYEDVNILFPTDRIILDYLKATTQCSNVLDYGCGSGRLLSHLKGDFKKYGVEINQEAIKKAFDRGITIVDEKDLTVSFNGFFDAVLLTDVYEHAFQPNELLSQLLTSLKPGGILIISTGIADQIKYQTLTGYYWYYRVFSHLQMASLKHLNFISKHFDLRIESIKTTSHYDGNALIFIKKLVAETVFKVSKRSRKLTTVLSGISKRFDRSRNWKYPLFDMYNRDHVVCVLAKAPGRSKLTL